jgi:hypothetical protein
MVIVVKDAEWSEGVERSRNWFAGGKGVSPDA